METGDTKNYDVRLDQLTRHYRDLLVGCETWAADQVALTQTDLEFELRLAIEKKDATIDRQAQHLDLMRDEFKRISVVAHSISDAAKSAIVGSDISDNLNTIGVAGCEIVSLCERADKVIKQNVPLIEQRDYLEGQLSKEKLKNETALLEMAKIGSAIDLAKANAEKRGQTIYYCCMAIILVTIFMAGFGIIALAFLSK